MRVCAIDDVVGMIADKYGRKSALGLSLIGTIVSYLSITMATSIPLLFLRYQLSFSTIINTMQPRY